jgi:hypothetical protein
MERITIFAFLSINFSVEALMEMAVIQFMVLLHSLV